MNFWTHEEVDRLLEGLNDENIWREYTCGTKAEAYRLLVKNFLPARSTKNIEDKLTHLMKRYREIRTLVFSRPDGGVSVITDADLNKGIDTVEKKVKSMFAYYYDIEDRFGASLLPQSATSASSSSAANLVPVSDTSSMTSLDDDTGRFLEDEAEAGGLADPPLMGEYPVTQRANVTANARTMAVPAKRARGSSAPSSTATASNSNRSTAAAGHSARAKRHAGAHAFSLGPSPLSPGLGLPTPTSVPLLSTPATTPIDASRPDLYFMRPSTSANMLPLLSPAHSDFHPPPITPTAYPAATASGSATASAPYPPMLSSFLYPPPAGDPNTHAPDAANFALQLSNGTITSSELYQLFYDATARRLQQSQTRLDREYQLAQMRLSFERDRLQQEYAVELKRLDIEREEMRQRTLLLELELSKLQQRDGDKSEQMSKPVPAINTILQNLQAAANPIGSTAKPYHLLLLSTAMANNDVRSAVSQNNITVFAPTDSAIQPLLTNGQTPPGDILRTVLAYSILPGVWDAQALKDYQVEPTTYATANTSLLNLGDNKSQVVSLTNKDSKATVSNGLTVATVIDWIPSSNGLIGVVDQVLTPPKTASQTLTAANATTLVSALTNSSLASTVDGLRGVTIFAPTNDAFNKAQDQLNRFNANQRKALLSYHAVQNNVIYSPNITNTNLTTVQGENLVLKNDNGKLTVNGANIVKTDVFTSNGVIHFIDTVLVPGSFGVNTSSPDTNGKVAPPSSAATPLDSHTSLSVVAATAVFLSALVIARRALPRLPACLPTQPHVRYRKTLSSLPTESESTTTDLDAIYQQLDDNCVMVHRVGQYYQLHGERSTRWSNFLNLGQFSGKCSDGFPVRNADEYVGELVRQGVHVAIVDYTQRRRATAASSPSTPKSLVRVVTPGTWLGAGSSDSVHPRTLLTISPPFKSQNAESERQFGLAFCDLASSSVHCVVASQHELTRAVRAITPAEIVLPQSLVDLATTAAHDPHFSPPGTVETFTQMQSLLDSIPITPRPDDFFRVESMPDRNLSVPFECRSALRGLARYLEQTFIDRPPSLRRPVRTDLNTTRLDPSALKSLNVLTGSSNTAAGSLRSFIDHTPSPFTEIAPLEARYDYIDLVNADEGLRHRVDAILGSVARCAALDLIVQKIVTGGDQGSRELLYINLLRYLQAGVQLVQVNELQPALRALAGGEVPNPTQMAVYLGNIINLDRASGEMMIKRGYSADIDRLSAQRDELVAQIQRHFDAFVSKYGLPREVSFLRRSSGGDAPTYIELPVEYHKQFKRQHRCEADEAAEIVMVFYEPINKLDTELTLLNEQLTDKVDQVLLLLRDRVRYLSPVLLRLHSMVSELDVVHGLAEIARTQDYTRPQLTTDPVIRFRDGRHPTVQQRCKDDGRQVTLNDCNIDAVNGKFVQVLSGPNMGGKSTYVRQVGVICLLAQIGSFVPASQATLGLFDTIFARFGSYDDTILAQSSFMSEVLDIVHAFKHATPRSLILLDELGRGTAPIDAVALNIAVVMRLATLRTRTLMTTHFHELQAELSESFPDLSEDVEFRHSTLVEHTLQPGKVQHTVDYKLREGMSTQSYGLEIASNLDLPNEVIRYAFMIADSLRSNHLHLSVLREDL
ncbi:hypothetical protein RI367_001643 [Sorochytrium milnesiophthora]